MSKILDIVAYEILDNRGIPALQVTLILNDNTRVSASSATNLFPPNYGVIDIKDNNPKHYRGNGLTQVISIIEKVIKPRIVGMDCTNQQEVDKALISMDSSVNKSKIGGNAMIAISMAVARAASVIKKEPLYMTLQKIITAQGVKLPVPVFTMIDGGKNANYNTEIHEFLIIPASFKTLSESLELGTSIHGEIAQILLKENILPFVGEKGGFGPLLSTNEDAISLIAQAFESLNIRLGYDAYIGIDANANSFYKDQHYKLKDNSIPMSRTELVKFYSELSEKYHILYLEDPMSDDDINGWTDLYAALNKTAIIAGDYFTSTNPFRLQMALEKKTVNGIVIKPASIGTITEALAVAEMAKAAGIKVVISDRTSATNDTFLTDFAVAVSADYVRFGAPARGERIAKYNRLTEIARELGVIY